MTPDQIIVHTARRHGVPVSLLTGPARTQHACRIRNEAVARAVSAGIAETEIARALGRDQTSIRNSLRRYQEAAQ